MAAWVAVVKAVMEVRTMITRFQVDLVMVEAENGTPVAVVAVRAIGTLVTAATAAAAW